MFYHGKMYITYKMNMQIQHPKYEYFQFNIQISFCHIEYLFLIKIVLKLFKT